MVRCWFFGVLLTLQVSSQTLPTTDVLKAIVDQLLKNPDFKDEISVGNNGIAQNLVAIAVDLNKDGKPEFIVHGINSPLCGAQTALIGFFGKTEPDGSYFSMRTSFRESKSKGIEATAIKM